MDKTMKHRLIGSLVWLALAAIILPLFMNGEGLQNIPQTSLQDLPATPKTLQSIVIEPSKDKDDPISITPFKASEGATLSNITKSVSPLFVDKQSDSDSILNHQGLPQAWVVQLASFKKMENANSLRDKLIKAKYTAYVQQYQSHYRVFIGPFPERKDAEVIRSKLKSAYKLHDSGIVMVYKQEQF